MLYSFYWLIPRRLNFICRRFETLCSIFIGWPKKMEQTECSETSAHKIQTPRNNPKEGIKQWLIYSFRYIRISNKMQRYTAYLFLENCSTRFGWYLHPSSGAHTTVFTVSGTCQTVTATCRHLNTVVCAPDDGWRYHPKRVEQFSRNK